MISEFKDENRFLSNFFPAPITFSGKTWPSAEHVFQAAKTLDPEARERIRRMPTPAKAKQAGKYLVLREDWAAVKVEIMWKILRLKFKQNRHLANLLLATGDRVLVEGNTWHDNFWGVCQCQRCHKTGDIGLNRLGFLLMELRDELKKDPGPH